MITQEYLDTEIELARKIFMYYTDRLYNYLAIGSDKYQVWYRDSLQLYFLLSLLETIILYDGVSYIGYYEMSDDILRSTADKVREYYTTECETSGVYGDPGLIITVPTTRDLYLVDWKEVAYTITSNGTVAFTLPFTYTNIDPESMSVIVEGYGAINQTVDGEGFHITGNIFNWHHYFNLDTGAKVHFRYKQIAGL